MSVPHLIQEKPGKSWRSSGRSSKARPLCGCLCVFPCHCKSYFFSCKTPQSLCLVFLLTLTHDLLTPMLLASAFFIVALLSCLFVAPFLSIFCVRVSSLFFPWFSVCVFLFCSSPSLVSFLRIKCSLSCNIIWDARLGQNQCQRSFLHSEIIRWYLK